MTLRCKVGDLCIAVGPARPSPTSEGAGDCARGAIVEVVGPAKMAGHDWSIVWPGHPCPIGDGSWAAKDSELIPLRPGETEPAVERELEVTA